MVKGVFESVKVTFRVAELDEMAKYLEELDYAQ